MTECYEHDFVSMNCINCGGFLGECCQNCGYLWDGGDWIASQEEMWCHCPDSISNYDYIHGWDNHNDMDGYHTSQYMEPKIEDGEK